MLANQVLDFYDDEPKSILKKIAHKIPKKVLSSELTKVASKNSSYALQILTKKGSALNKFPVTTPADTAISNLYFEENHQKLPTAARQTTAFFLKEASLRHDLKVPPIIDKYAGDTQHPSNVYDENRGSFLNSFEKRANVRIEKKDLKDESIYAVPSLKKFAMPNEEYVKKAQAYFDQNSHRLDPEIRKEFAENVMRRGQELETEISSNDIHKYASNDYAKNPIQALNQRQQFVKKGSLKRVLTKMAGFVEKTEPKEFVDAIFSFDKKAGIQGLYGKHINDPYMELLAGKPLSKTASYKFFVKTSGVHLSGEELQEVFEKKAEKIKEYFGESLSDGLKQNGIEAFEALPGQTKEIIGQIAVGAI